MPSELTWTSWPARRQPFLSLMVALFCLAVSWWAMSLMGNPWWAFVTLLVLAAATCDHFIPMRYRLSAEGVELRGPGGVRQYRWNVFTSAEASGDRVALYSRSRRKLTLRCEDNCEAVLEYIQQHTTN